MSDAKDSCFSSLCIWENYLGIHSSSIWNMVLACLMWLIWRKQNTRTFEDIEKCVDLLKSLLVGTLLGGLTYENHLSPQK